MTYDPHETRTGLMQSLALDAAAAEAVGALEAAGIPSLLLKGPVVATRLFADRSQRRYCDIDLLVEPSSFGRAGRVIERLGYVDLLAGASPWEYSSHATTFGREGRLPAYLDLHRTLPWCRSRPRELWAVLSTHATELCVGGRPCPVPDDAGLALILAGHALQHDFAPRTRTDLELALERFEAGVWREALARADQLGAASVIAAALSGLSAPWPSRNGLGAAERLELCRPSVVHGLHTISAAGSLPAAVRLAFRKLVPSPAYMRLWVRWEAESNGRPVPLDGQGLPGLLSAYATRLARRGVLLPGAVRQWRDARAAAG